MSTDAQAAAGLWPEGYDRIILPETDSTMAEARRRAPDLGGPVWILALRQSAAHGRRGRIWASPEGNFAATLLMRPEGDAGQAALRSFTAAVALYQTFGRFLDRSRFSLKWPNDVLLDGGKVAGILLESSGGRPDWLAIGIGVNLLAAPDPAGLETGAVPPVSLAEQGGPAISPEVFLEALAGHFATLERLFRDAGFDAIRRLWLLHAARLGDIVTARLPGEEITGTFETIDATGRLILRTPDGPRAIAAADVYF